MREASGDTMSKAWERAAACSLEPHLAYISARGNSMEEIMHEVARDGLDPFSVEGFRQRAVERGYNLAMADWMAAQPPSYGVDAGRRLDADGNPDNSLRLEHIVNPLSWRMSAVLIPVVAREPSPTVLLTLRPAHLSAHAGQIAFPGGKIDETDTSPVAAAVREAEEEVGLNPHLVTPLSLLDLHNTGTGFRIIPVIALVDPSFTALPQRGEVEDVFEVPLTFLMSEANHVTQIRDFKKQRVQFYAMEYETRMIWGATAAIIRNVYDKLYAPDTERTGFVPE